MIDKLAPLFERYDAVFVSAPSDVFYFSRFEGEGYIAAFKDGAFYVTDGRYAEEAAAATGLEVVTVTAEKPFLKALKLIAERNPQKPVGVQTSALSYNEHLLAAETAGNLNSIDAFLSDLRAVKEDFEIALVARAAAITDAAFLEILSVVRENMTERELAAETEYRLRLAGADGTAFATIAAFGTDGSKPHARPGDTALRRGMLVTLDFGARAGGYCSDMTRTFAFGKPSAEMKKIYGLTLKANLAGLATVRDGVTCFDADAAARNLIKNANYGEYFLHGTGHGVGIDIHETPTLSYRSAETLKTGMVVTVEPGIYLAGKGGVRIEDMVAVTASGCDILSHSAKELLIL
ncbi:MAG: aminopeptidase P family protein [Clostridiaceae bacterium]|jgi:Xaa-Pro aminopeptidase|nr:aminopeptidase P family protein [Clostridiaceae bacterium]